MGNQRAIIVAIFLLSATPLVASIINVPLDQPTIQQGIDVAVNGDTVLVAPNTYFQNIHFREKGIVVASHYLLNNNPAYIESTIINGSMPNYPDSGSCVRIVSDSAYTTGDTSAALIGFTITGGSGTKWQDEHGAGLYREGGGILIQYLSPRIKHNIIKDNHITDAIGVTSTGGGAIRCGDGNPTITNNVIVSNSALYGGGVVLNYTGALVKNNIFAYDSAGDAYGGGGGLWIFANGTFPKVVENNTIVCNSPGTYATGGGIRLWNANATLRNNIIWANEIGQIYRTGGAVTVTYSNVQGGYAGEGNIDSDPFFQMQNFYLSDSSPCIDAGDTSSLYNDPEDPFNPGQALWPSMGFLRNDMGVYGGPGRTILPNVPTGVQEYSAKAIESGMHLQNFPNPFSGGTTITFFRRSLTESIKLVVYDAAGRLVRDLSEQISTNDRQSSCIWDGRTNTGQHVSSGVYFCNLKTDGQESSIRMILTK